ncbi:sensor histidine kinase [Bacillus alkalicola]|uniref:histidine kinase n=2 Tax=Bacillales TaxID=1385 RepID=A0ABS6JNF0_9BACI|nr:sensor histidine kinase [Bacillus alkalicola]
MISWLFALLQFEGSLLEIPFQIVGSAAFFAVIFLLPLFKKNQIIYTIIMSAAALLAVIILWPENDGTVNVYVLLVFTIIAGMSVITLSWQSVFVGGILLTGMVAPYFSHYPSFAPAFLILYGALLSLALVTYRQTKTKVDGIEARNEALFSEYRKLKRRLVNEEQAARQEERAQIAREIHDSVGHKLTALLMQLEVVRMEQKGQEDQVDDQRLLELKQLAKESLEETRSAVKTLKQDEVGGLTAIIRLIRKLEAENYMRVHFSIRHGALTAPLGNEQSVAVYRAVQEALTNVMRHSGGREVEIVFEAPAGGVFRFEVSNPLKTESRIKEGFGLSSMRERMEQVGGTLDIAQYDDQFIVRGTLPLLDVNRRGTE